RLVGSPAWDGWPDIGPRRDSPVVGAARSRAIVVEPVGHFIPDSALAGTEPPLAKPPSVTALNRAVCIASIDGSNHSPAENLPDSSHRFLGRRWFGRK